MEATRPVSVECPVCAGSIGEREQCVCPRCETPHHIECYSYNRGCAVFGCNPDAPSTPLPKKLLEPVARRVLVVLPVMAVALVAIGGLAYWDAVGGRHSEPTVGVGGQGGPESPEPCGTRAFPSVGRVAPDFTLKDLDGTPHSLGSLTRGHVAVLTFWLAGCPDCLGSFPKGVELSKEFRDKGVRFSDVAYMGQPGATAAWVKQSGIVNPVLLDSDGQVVRTYALGTYTCFVLDPAGTIRYRGPVEGAGAVLRALL